MVVKLRKKGCPPETAQELAVLVLYDLVILLDDSHSMVTEAGGTRIATLFKVLKAVVEVYQLARDGGVVSVRYLNGRQGHKDITKNKMEVVHATIRYTGITMLGTQLRKKILKPFVEQKQMRKPLLSLILTDGNIEGERKGLLEKNIYNCLARLQKDAEKTEDAVAFMFARIGEDPEGKELLEELDDHPIMGSWIDCLPGAL
ncbi:hypothetical protein BZA05DRAFT_344825 [Tricharina praecox]|uniref:uncharacterized protein n=1 Tax=Tricharina praecox TaxID=43433 RepID=UPI00221E5BAF|nr:uncharacterized protein BZA05DRAFT_344825 [Tricharina praecox]KAI5841688.1 hypothetical protein BZA05DRAFT_344825 [Tricharina praecox]